MADQAGMKAIHMMTSGDPGRNPTFAYFADADYFLTDFPTSRGCPGRPVMRTCSELNAWEEGGDAMCFASARQGAWGQTATEEQARDGHFRTGAR
jgi:hypothetical protein